MSRITEIIELRKAGYSKEEIKELYELSAADAQKPAVQQEITADEQPNSPDVSVNNGQLTIEALNIKLDTLLANMQAASIRNSAQPEVPEKSGIEVLGEFLVPPLN